MATLHAKSPCCRGRVNHFGSRRRQCSICKHTWRIRQKCRGRKRKRVAVSLLNRILLERHTIAQEERNIHLSRSGIAVRYSKAMRLLASRPHSLHLRSRAYALIGDGLYFKFRRKEWVMYLMAVKPAHCKKAYFLDPVLLEGRECYERWVQAIAAIPPNIKKRVCAFVSDGF